MKSNILNRKRNIFKNKFFTCCIVFFGLLITAGLLKNMGFLFGLSRNTVILVTQPVREEPEVFPINTHMPSIREGIASGSIDLNSFSPDRDLVRIDDSRVWWESDHDRGGDEDDHIIHKAMEIQLRRLIELVSLKKGRLKVQDAYRPVGIHNYTSLHKEGRAVDLTCEKISMEELAKLCWAAGFNWVYYEDNSKNGVHVHSSVSRYLPVKNLR